MTIQSVWEAASDSQYGKTESLLGRNHYKGAAGWESQPTRIKKERTISAFDANVDLTARVQPWARVSKLPIRRCSAGVL